MGNCLTSMNDEGSTTAAAIRYWLAGTVTIGALPRMPVSEMENSSITNPKVSSEPMSPAAIQNQ